MYVQRKVRKALALLASLSITSLVLVAAGSTAVIQSVSAEVASASCITGTNYHHAFGQSSYSTGVDGVSGLIDFTSGLDPYVCNTSKEHTLESLGLYLPVGGGSDYIEIGEDKGVINSITGQTFNNANGLYFFNYTDTLFANGTDYLSVPQSGPFTGTSHTNTAQEVVSCTPICALHADYTTDSTVWTPVALPSGDNPGTLVTSNGEVQGDTADTMGYATFTNLEVHAGSWIHWQNQNLLATALPYCNINTSGIYYSSKNYGPETSC